MRILILPEIVILIRDSGVCCTQEMVEDWLKDGSLKNIKKNDHYIIHEQDIEDFVYDHQWDGSPFERGIDDSEKIERLLLEIRDLKDQVSKLQGEKINLEIQLGKLPF